MCNKINTHSSKETTFKRPVIIQMYKFFNGLENIKFKISVKFIPSVDDAQQNFGK